MLTLSLGYALLFERETGSHRTSTGLSNELRKQFIFHWGERLARVANTFDHRQAVQASEQAGEGFQMRFPLGPLWYGTSFAEILEGHWPFFGLLDLVSKYMVAMGHLKDNVNMKAGTVEIRPVRVPTIRCQLEPARDGSVRLELLRTPKYYGKRKSTAELLQNTDACSLLGVAAGRFHHARAEIRRLLRAEGVGAERYQALANWTPECTEQRSVTHRECSSRNFQDCAAIADNNRIVPQRCLRLHRTSGRRSGVRLRSRLRLADSRVFSWIEEGERLLRDFIERHGLYAAVWAAGRQELAPLKGGAVAQQENRWPTPDEIAERETMFSVLQSIQEEISFEDDGFVH
eukprot:TRINITY_DN49477_c0_g1_i1.p1 TRINITY_DN49477_c0_g1~~TRINITY_DN49477_c0_g1_i1.p1  ORF type:complete len:401 (+),score=88.13 TRINITY_DN49477_c0_g1_i1:168-1205(+)